MSTEFIQHLMRRQKCYAPGRRYCDEGKALKIDSDADFFVADLIKIAKKEDRAAYMQKHCKAHLDMESLKKAIVEKYQAVKKLERLAV